MGPKLGDLGADEWLLPVSTIIKERPLVTIHVNMGGFPTGATLDSFLAAARAGKSDSAYATYREMKMLVQAVINGDREWSSIAF